MSEHISYGVTTDFDWYELKVVSQELSILASRIERVIQASVKREETQHEWIVHLKKENDHLQAQLNALRKD